MPGEDQLVGLVRVVAVRDLDDELALRAVDVEHLRAVGRRSGVAAAGRACRQRTGGAAAARCWSSRRAGLGRAHRAGRAGRARIRIRPGGRRDARARPSRSRSASRPCRPRPCCCPHPRFPRRRRIRSARCRRSSRPPAGSPWPRPPSPTGSRSSYPLHRRSPRPRINHKSAGAYRRAPIPRPCSIALPPPTSSRPRPRRLSSATPQHPGPAEPKLWHLAVPRGPSDDPVQRAALARRARPRARSPPGRARAAARGAACGARRSRRGPRSPSACARMKLPMPCTSRAGFAAREGDPQEVVERARAELAVVADHDQRKRRDRVARRELAAEARDRRLVARRCAPAYTRGPRTASTPGMHSAGARETRPAGAARPARSSAASRTRRADRRDHQLAALVERRRPSSRACRSWSRSGSAGRAADRSAEHVREERRHVVRCRARGRRRGSTISRYLASDICPWPSMALAWVSSSCGRVQLGGTARSARCRSPAAADARPRRRPRAPRARRARTVGITGAVSSWISAPNAGVLLRRPADHRERPDRVLAVVDLLDAQHREVVRQAVVAEVIAERALRACARVGIDRADQAEVGVGVHRQRAVACAGRQRETHAPAG